MQEYFGAVAYWKRLVLLRVQTPELLAQGTKRSHRGRQRQMLEQARHQLRDQMTHQRRRQFRGDVAVDLTIFAHGAGTIPATPRTVKRYLDAMNGIVYSDDRQIAHLAVHRLADDWPGLAASRARGIDLPTALEQQVPQVSISVIPISVFSADWERVFRMGEHTTSSGRFGADDFKRCWQRFTEDTWTNSDDLKLEELVRERRRDEVYGTALERFPSEMADMIRESRQRDIAEMLERLMLDQRPGPDDHPLAEEATIDAELLARFALADPGPRPRWDLPGSFWLPLRPEASGWEQAVRDTMMHHRERWKVLPEAFERPLGLDIAAFGVGPHGRDIDNLAHAVLTPFERMYCGEHRGTVVSYRAYRRPSMRPGVRVLVMSERRMSQLGELIEEARSAVIDQGVGESDW